MTTCKYFPKKTLGYITDDLWYLKGGWYDSSYAYEFSVCFKHAVLEQDHMEKRIINKCWINMVKWCFVEIIDFVAC